MKYFFIWNPSQKQYILLVNNIPPALSHTTCTFCEKIEKFYLRKISSKIYFKDIEFDIIPEDLYSLDKVNKNSNLAKSVLHFPVYGNEWAFPLTKSHSFSVENVTKKEFNRVFLKGLKEIKYSLIKKEEVKHIICLLILFLETRSTISHPQLRCFEFNHDLLKPFRIHENSNLCALCNEISLLEKNKWRTVKRRDGFISFEPLLKLQKKEIIITTAKHASFEKLKNEDLKKLSQTISDIIFDKAEKMDNENILIMFFDMLKRSHVYIRVFELEKEAPLYCSLMQVLNDRRIKVIFNYEE